MVDENIVLEDPALTRKSWIDTINEIKVQYSEIYGMAYSYWCGYFAGGGASAVIDALRFVSETLAPLAAQLSQLNANIEGLTASRKGYLSGEQPKIEALRYADETCALTGTSLPSGARRGAGVTSPYKGYIGGGDANKVIYKIDALRYPDESAYVLQGQLSFARLQITGAESDVRGFFCTGYDPGYNNKIQFIVFSNETVGTLGDAVMPSDHYSRAGASSKDKSYFAGGFLLSDGTTIDRIDALRYIDYTRSTLAVVLSQARSSLAAIQSPTKGFFGGGGTGGTPRNRIDALVFSSETVYQSTEVLSQARNQLAGVSTPVEG